MEKQIFKRVGFITFIYSILVFTGGLMGFIMKQSTPSLIAGSLFGLALLFTSIKTITFHRWALNMTLLLTLALDTFFSYRYLATQKLFPAGAMLFITSLTLILMIFQIYKLKKMAH